MKKLLAMLLAVAVVLSMAACGNTKTPAGNAGDAGNAGTNTETPATYVDPFADVAGDYDELSMAV